MIPLFCLIASLILFADVLAKHEHTVHSTERYSTLSGSFFECVGGGFMFVIYIVAVI